MRRYLRSTRGRFTILALLIMAVALGATDAGLYFSLEVGEDGQVAAALRQSAEALAARVEVRGSAITYSGGQTPTTSPDGSSLDVAVVGAAGPVAASQGQPLSAVTLRGLAHPVLRSGEPLSVIFYDSRGVHRRAYALRLAGRPDLALVVSRPLTLPEAFAWRTLLVLLAVSLIVLVLAGVLVHVLVGRVLSPVRRIAGLAESLSERDLHRRIDTPVPDDELGELVGTFNRLLARLQSSFEALRRFTSDASHELRAPITLMAGEVELSLARHRSESEYRRVLGVVRSELAGMAAMVERLLDLARADAGELRARLEPVDVPDLVHETVARWTGRATARDVRVEAACPQVGETRADRELTVRILDNLLENAIRHSPRGSVVRVTAAESDGSWRIFVADRGPGVPPTHRDRVFERYATLDPARTARTEGGTGLGLALSAAFATAQGADLEIVDLPGWGAVFQLSIPQGMPDVVALDAGVRGLPLP